MKVPVAIFTLLLLLIPSVPAFACKPMAGYKPPPPMTEQDYLKMASVVVTGRVTALQAEPTNEWEKRYHSGNYRISFSVDFWQKGSGPQTLELVDFAHYPTDCDALFPPPNTVATYYMNHDPASMPEDVDYTWKVYAVMREGKLTVTYAVPLQKIRPVLQSGPDWETVRLEREEMVEGFSLPAGTELIVRHHPVTHAIVRTKAILHQRTQFKGLVLVAGTTLLFSKAEQEDRIRASGGDPRTAVIYTDIIAPSPWSIGTLRIDGRVRVGQQGDSLLVACGGQPGELTRCRQGGYPVLLAEFGPGLRPRKITIGSKPGVDGEPFRIHVGRDVLEAIGSIEYWPDGNLRTLTLTGRQTLRGKEVAGTLRFSPTGNLLENNNALHCRNGEEVKSLREASASGGYLEACSDGSLVYIETRAMCLHPELARQKYDFLRNRSRGTFRECMGGTSYSVGGPSYLLVEHDPE